MDLCGRLLPAPNRFPSAAGGKGFKPLADEMHAMGLKFGVHVMRGIPRQAVAAKSPIEGTSFTAADAANTASTCRWCPDMFGVDATKPAGQAYYNSVYKLYASWDVDYVKVDDSFALQRRRNRGHPQSSGSVRTADGLQHVARRNTGGQGGAC